VLGYRPHKCVSQIEIRFLAVSGPFRPFPGSKDTSTRYAAGDGPQPTLSWRYRDGCPAPEYDRNWCRCRHKSWSYARAAPGQRPGIPAGCRGRFAGPALNGRPRSRHLPGRSPVGRRPPRSTAAPGSRPGPGRSPWSEALMTLRPSNRARLTPRGWCNCWRSAPRSWRSCADSAATRPEARPQPPRQPARGPPRRDTPPLRALGAPVSQSLSAPVGVTGRPYTVGGAPDPHRPAPRWPDVRRAGASRRRGAGRTAQRDSRGPCGRTGLFRDDDDPPDETLRPTVPFGIPSPFAVLACAFPAGPAFRFAGCRLPKRIFSLRAVP